jgi:hypothetical protein
MNVKRITAFDQIVTDKITRKERFNLILLRILGCKMFIYFMECGFSRILKSDEAFGGNGTIGATKKRK